MQMTHDLRRLARLSPAASSMKSSTVTTNGTTEERDSERPAGASQDQESAALPRLARLAASSK